MSGNNTEKNRNKDGTLKRRLKRQTKEKVQGRNQKEIGGPKSGFQINQDKSIFQEGKHDLPLQ